MAAWTTATRTWAVGETVTAANMNAQIRDFANGFGAWAAYTPTVTGFTSVVTTPVGYYAQVQKTAHVRANVTIGAVTTLGASTINITLPATASGTQGTNRMTCGVFRNNAGVLVPCAILISNSGTTWSTLAQTPGGANPNLTGWTGANPAGQVAGDYWSWDFDYETA